MKLHFVENMDEVLKIALEGEIIAYPCRPRSKWRRSRLRRPGALAAGRLARSDVRIGGLPPASLFGRLIAEFIVSAASPEQFPSDGLPEIAFLGRSNAGKSSLINALIGCKGWLTPATHRVEHKPSILSDHEWATTGVGTFTLSISRVTVTARFRR